MKSFVFAILLISTLGLRTNLRARAGDSCFEHCAQCLGDDPSYATCTSCKAGFPAMPLDDGSVYCIEYCPTGFDTTDCLPPSASSILESWQFHDNMSYEGERGSIIDIVRGKPAPHYAGYYFVDENSYLTIRQDFTLPLDFTMSSWVLLEGSVEEQTFFSKDSFAEDDGSVYLRTFVTPDNKLACQLGAEPLVDQSSWEFPVGVWEYYAISIAMNSDAMTSTVRFIKGRSNTQMTFTSSQKFVDHYDGGDSFLGSTRVDRDTHSSFMKGFVFNFHIDNGFYQQFTPLHYGNNLECSCNDDSICAETISNCVGDGDCQSGVACLSDLDAPEAQPPTEAPEPEVPEPEVPEPEVTEPEVPEPEVPEPEVPEPEEPEESTQFVQDDELFTISRGNYRAVAKDNGKWGKSHTNVAVDDSMQFRVWSNDLGQVRLQSVKYGTFVSCEAASSQNADQTDYGIFEVSDSVNDGFQYLYNAAADKYLWTNNNGFGCNWNYIKENGTTDIKIGQK